MIKKSLMILNNEVFEKTKENFRNFEIELVTTKERRNYQVSEPNYHKKQLFFR